MRRRAEGEVERDTIPLRGLRTCHGRKAVGHGDENEEPDSGRLGDAGMQRPQSVKVEPKEI